MICLLLLMPVVVDAFNTQYVAGVSVYSMIIPSVLSITSSTCVVLSYMLFPALRRLRYVELLTYTSFNDILFCIGTLMGSVKTGSAACWYQGLTGNFCVVASAFWTTVITYQLYLAVVRGGKVLKNMFWTRVIAVVGPIFLSLLPLTTNSYANVSGSYCFIDRSDGDRLRQKLWMVFSFYFWIFLCVVIQFGLLVAVANKLYRLEIKEGTNSDTVSVIWKSFRKLIWYPTIFSVCWTFDAVADLSGLEESQSHSNSSSSSSSRNVVTEDFVITGVTLSMLQGFFFSLAFFINNRIVRECWQEFLRNVRIEILIYCGVDTDGDLNNIDNRNSSNRGGGGDSVISGSISAQEKERPSVFDLRKSNAKIKSEPDFILREGQRQGQEYGDDADRGFSSATAEEGVDVIPGAVDSSSRIGSSALNIDTPGGGQGDVKSPVWSESAL